MFRDSDKRELINIDGKSISESQRAAGQGVVAHLMPNTMGGDTPIVDNQLSKVFYSNDGTKQEAIVTYHKKGALFPFIADSNTKLLFSCYPLSPDKSKKMDKSGTMGLEDSDLSGVTKRGGEKDTI